MKRGAFIVLLALAPVPASGETIRWCDQAKLVNAGSAMGEASSSLSSAPCASCAVHSAPVPSAQSCSDSKECPADCYNDPFDPDELLKGQPDLVHAIQDELKLRAVPPAITVAMVLSSLFKETGFTPLAENQPPRPDYDNVKQPTKFYESWDSDGGRGIGQYTPEGTRYRDEPVLDNNKPKTKEWNGKKVPVYKRVALYCGIYECEGKGAVQDYREPKDKPTLKPDADRDDLKKGRDWTQPKPKYNKITKKWDVKCVVRTPGREKPYFKEETLSESVASLWDEKSCLNRPLWTQGTKKIYSVWSPRVEVAQKVAQFLSSYRQKVLDSDPCCSAKNKPTDLAAKWKNRPAPLARYLVAMDNRWSKVISALQDSALEHHKKIGKCETPDLDYGLVWQQDSLKSQCINRCHVDVIAGLCGQDAPDNSYFSRFTKWCSRHGCGTEASSAKEQRQ